MADFEASAATISALLPYLLDPQLDLHFESDPAIELDPIIKSEPTDLEIVNKISEQSAKRKYESDAPERNVRIREALERNEMDFNQPLTTVTCLHASVAQKSYGKEKRYLSPPPLVALSGPMKDLLEKPSLMLSVISESGERGGHQKSRIGEPTMEAYFQSLHVQATSKAKSFSLQLTLHPPTERKAAATIEEAQSILHSPFASFDSAPIPIISKPSKKTAKARNMNACILNGSTISLFSRINSQTARTKFMAVDDGKLSAKTFKWSAFRIDVVRSTEDYLAQDFEESAPVTYGSEVTLTDVLTGSVSEMLLIRKVEKGFLCLDATGPVSQLQKLAFARAIPDGQSIYLSVRSDGMDLYGSVPDDVKPVIDNGSKIIKKVSKSKAKALLENSGMGPDTEVEEAALLSYSRAAVETSEQGESHELDDFTCWTVTGINSFSYSFFNAFSAELKIPTTPITPFPIISSEPQYRPHTHCIEVPISNYFYTIPGTTQTAPLEIWLGSIGPLVATIIDTGATTADLAVQENIETVEETEHIDAPVLNLGTFLSVELPSIEEITRKAETRIKPTTTRNAIYRNHQLETPVASTSNSYFSPPEDRYNYAYEDIALMVSKINEVCPSEADLDIAIAKTEEAEMETNWNDQPDLVVPTLKESNGLSGIARVLAEQEARDQEAALRAFEEETRILEPILALDLMVVRPSDGITYLTNWKISVDDGIVRIVRELDG